MAALILWWLNGLLAWSPSRKQSGKRLSKVEEERVTRAQRSMGPCYYEVAQVYIGMKRADCLPKVCNAEAGSVVHTS